MNRSPATGNDSGEEMMLIGEASDIQIVCLRAPGDTHPIHVHRDVRVTNSLERRIQISMLRADLNAFVKFIAQIRNRSSKHNRDAIARNSVNPIERRLIAWPFFLGGWELVVSRAAPPFSDKSKIVAIEIDKFVAWPITPA